MYEYKQLIILQLLPGIWGIGTMIFISGKREYFITTWGNCMIPSSRENEQTIKFPSYREMVTLLSEPHFEGEERRKSYWARETPETVCGLHVS